MGKKRLAQTRQSVSPNAEDIEFVEGQRVIAQGAFSGCIRFTGTTKFAAGTWVGIELDEPAGKNDGSVKGVTYFRCDAKHGVFLRPSQVRVMDNEMGRQLRWQPAHS